MTWEYSGDPSTSTKDAVRFLIGDTNDADQLLSDEEVEYLLTVAGDAAADAAVAACNVLAMRYAKQVSKAVGDLRIEYSDRAKNFAALAKEIGTTGGIAGVAARPIPYAGGISVDDKERQEDDDDRVEPGFVVGEGDSRRRRDEWFETIP